MRWGGGGAGSSETRGLGFVETRDASASSESPTDGLGPGLGPGLSATPPRERVPSSATLRRFFRSLANIFLVSVEAPLLFILRATMPDLAGDPARKSRLLIAALPVTAPLFFVSAERLFPFGGVAYAAGGYGLACSALGSVALWCAWPLLLRPDANRESVLVMDATLTVVAFAVSATWMHVCAGELLALAHASAIDALGWNWDADGFSDEISIPGYGSASSGHPERRDGWRGLARKATFQVLTCWCKNSASAFTAVALARVGKPAAAIAACFSQATFSFFVVVPVSALVAYAYGSDELANPGMRLPETHPRTLFTNGVTFAAAFVAAVAAYAAFAVPWAHEWRVGRLGACGFASAYFVFLIFQGVIDVGILARKPWF